MPARLDHHLNLVLPCDTSLGELDVFSTPVSYAVFERHYRVMARAWATISAMGGSASGPRVAALELRESAKALSLWEGAGGVELGLVAEIRRLTNVVRPAAGGGWEPVPLMDAVADGTLTAEDLNEIEGVVTFFILASAMLPRHALGTTLAFLEGVYGARTTSLDCSAWIASLQTSIGESIIDPSPTNTSVTGAPQATVLGQAANPPPLAY